MKACFTKSQDVGSCAEIRQFGTEIALTNLARALNALRGASGAW
jgi:hypothetical protein